MGSRGADNEGLLLTGNGDGDSLSTSGHGRRLGFRKVAAPILLPKPKTTTRGVSRPREDAADLQRHARSTAPPSSRHPRRSAAAATSAWPQPALTSPNN
ncbi:hypothetical protein PF003_g18646 [Phytophthora fragariae]|nr:hypothetical protein PF003_g18646 [Phytophthora fragariae]